MGSLKRPPALAVGQRVRFEGQVRGILEVTARAAVLEDAEAPHRVVALIDLFETADFEILFQPERMPLPASGLLETFSPEVMERALWWEKHILEVLHGLPPGAEPGTAPSRARRRAGHGAEAGLRAGHVSDLSREGQGCRTRGPRLPDQIWSGRPAAPPLQGGRPGRTGQAGRSPSDPQAQGVRRRARLRRRGDAAGDRRGPRHLDAQRVLLTGTERINKAGLPAVDLDIASRRKQPGTDG